MPSTDLFDINGYIVIKNALTPEQLADCRARIKAQRALDGTPDKAGFAEASFKGSDRTWLRAADGSREGEGLQSWSAPSLLEWGGSFIDLIDLPTISPKLFALFGDAPFRLDHDYFAVKNSESGGQLYLHGGGQGAGGPSDLVGPTDGGQCYYRYANGRFFNGLIAVAFEFETVQSGDGGFACIAGSQFPWDSSSHLPCVAGTQSHASQVLTRQTSSFPAIGKPLPPRRTSRPVSIASQPRQATRLSSARPALTERSP